VTVERESLCPHLSQITGYGRGDRDGYLYAPTSHERLMKARVTGGMGFVEPLLIVVFIFSGVRVAQWVMCDAV
jgi:hypothetical protein